MGGEIFKWIFWYIFWNTQTNKHAVYDNENYLRLYAFQINYLLNTKYLLDILL